MSIATIKKIIGVLSLLGSITGIINLIFGKKIKEYDMDMSVERYMKKKGL